MKASFSLASQKTQQHSTGQTRLKLIVTVALLAGAVVGGVFYFQHARTERAQAADNSSRIKLSPPTLSVLTNLNSPVDLRFYSLLDPASTPADLKGFAQRVDQMLSEYQVVTKGELKIARITEFTTANVNAALADGIRPFNLGAGDGCYLGIVVTRAGQKQTLAQLSPEWESALEFDLSRAIASVKNANPAASRTINSAKEIAAVRELVQSRPDLASASVEQGTQSLRDAALSDFKSLVTDTQTKIAAAEQRFKDAERANSESGKLAARKEILELQAAQAEQIKSIGARLQQQMAAFQQLKAAN